MCLLKYIPVQDVRVGIRDVGDLLSAAVEMADETDTTYPVLIEASCAMDGILDLDELDEEAYEGIRRGAKAWRKTQTRG